jgi:hypothetical protein
LLSKAFGAGCTRPDPSPGAFIPAIFGDVTTALVKSLGTAALKAFINRRAKEAGQILLEEVRKANIDAARAASEDDVIGVVFRFERAVREGTARLNIRLMAKAMAGRLKYNRLVADEFLLFADALAALSRDEIIVIAEMLIAYRAVQEKPPGPTAGDGIAAVPWHRAKLALENQGWTKDRITTAATRSQRSGFLIAQSAYGGLIFAVSDMLVELGKSVDFDDALRAEPATAASP